MRVLLGVTGGIAAYKACELLRRFTESGHDVTVVPTAAAAPFAIAPMPASSLKPAVPSARFRCSSSASARTVGVSTVAG